VLAREQNAGVSESQTVADVRATLHHNHLPQLDDAGLVDHDPADGTVAYQGHPDLPTEWIQSVPLAAGDEALLDGFREHVDAGTDRPDARNEGFLPETP
jgi:hypothetical protein